MKKNLVFALPLLACGMFFTACSNEDTIASEEVNSGNEATLLIPNANIKAPSISRATVNSEYKTRDDVRPTSDGEITKFNYTFKVGDKVYAYDPAKKRVSTFTCTNVIDGAAAKFTSSDATGNYTKGQPLYLFTSMNKPVLNPDNTLNFNYQNPENKGFFFGNNTADITKSVFTGFTKIESCPDLSNQENPYKLKATLDETPVMAAYYRDVIQDFNKNVRIAKSVQMRGSSSRGHYESATFDPTKIDGDDSFKEGSFVSGADALEIDLTQNSGVAANFKAGNTMYMPILPGHYDDARVTITGTGDNHEGDQTKIVYKVVKQDFDVKKNEVVNFGSVNGDKGKGNWSNIDADHLYIVGGATPFGYTKNGAANANDQTNPTRSTVWTVSQKMARIGSDFVYIGYSAGDSPDVGQLDDEVTGNKGGGGDYKFYFVNNGLYEGSGLMRADGNETPNGTTSSLGYYSSKDNTQRTDDKWKTPGTGWYKYTVNLHDKTLKVEPYTGTTPTFSLEGYPGHFINTINRLWMFGSAVNMTGYDTSGNFHQYGDYAAWLATAMNLNLAVSPDKFTWEGHLKQGLLKFPYVYGVRDLGKVNCCLAADATEATDLQNAWKISNTNNYQQVWAVHVNPTVGASQTKKMAIPATTDTANKTTVKDGINRTTEAQWYIETEGDYKIEVDVNNKQVTFTRIK